MTPFLVRRFRPSDLENVILVERASFGREAYDRKLFAEYARACGELFLVAEGREAGLVRNAVAGYAIACVCRGRPELANLISIAVAPEDRRNGVASLLLLSTIRRLKFRGIERLTLLVRQSNMPAIEFYRRHGFETVRSARRYYEDGEDGWLMRLTIPPHHREI